MKLVMLDNYDSFTYNIVQYLQMLGAEVVTIRNNRTTPEEVLGLGADALVLSPGPGKPSEAGILTDLIQAGAREKIPMLGVCLGHQAIGEVFGMKVIHAKRVMHGKASQITTDGRGILEGLPERLSVIRYHSLALDPETLPAELEISARAADDGEIMGIRHRTLPIEGVQYHPESVLSEKGMEQFENFLKAVRASRGREL